MNGSQDPFLEKKVSRRDFIDQVIRGGIFMTLAGMLAPALQYLWPVMGRGPSQEMQEVGRLEELPVGGAKKVIIGGSAVLVIRTAQTTVKAFSAICTHLGCLIDWNGPKRSIQCPCHAGVFDLEGRPVSGPPPRPLPSYTVKINDGKIFVKV